MVPQSPELRTPGSRLDDYVLRVYYVPGTALGARDRPALAELQAWQGRQIYVNTNSSAGLVQTGATLLVAQEGVLGEQESILIASGRSSAGERQTGTP